MYNGWYFNFDRGKKKESGEGTVITAIMKVVIGSNLFHGWMFHNITCNCKYLKGCASPSGVDSDVYSLTIVQK